MKDLVVECWDKLGMNEIRKMSFEELKELTKNCYSMSQSGLYDGRCSSYVVLMIKGELNTSLIPACSYKSRDTLVEKYNISKELIHKLVMENLEKELDLAYEL